MSALRKRGVGKGDRVAVVGSNSVDTLVVFLATAGVGGIVSTNSTDMGVKVRYAGLIWIRDSSVE